MLMVGAFRLVANGAAGFGFVSGLVANFGGDEFIAVECLGIGCRDGGAPNIIIIHNGKIIFTIER